ncbi:hypothetical protein ZIOFF_064993 [Zingiber officinale]|uniref:Uncharacterized protein n=1 Tax=Zingiber officinale TaxID=94328 RepID=A0A8J5EWL4_ZINOF|nr:hypothetical protein ZIOFF_064993 [Zingiber officinale]
MLTSPMRAVGNPTTEMVEHLDDMLWNAKAPPPRATKQCRPRAKATAFAFSLYPCSNLGASGVYFFPRTGGGGQGRVGADISGCFRFSVIFSSHLKNGYSPSIDHLQNHVHLTNCIHLQSHMHHGTPYFTERSLKRDLLMLQKSKYLKDPSTRPASRSPYFVADFAREAAKGGSKNGRRKSIGANRVREVGQSFKMSPLFGCIATAKVAADEAANEYDFEQRDRITKTSKEEDMTRRSWESDISSGNQVSLWDMPHKDVELVNRELNKQTKDQILHPKVLLENLEEVSYLAGNFCRKPSDLFLNGKHETAVRTNDEQEGRICDSYYHLERQRKFRLKGTRKTRVSADSRGIGAYHKPIDLSGPVAKESMNDKGYLDDLEEDNVLEVSKDPRTVCRIPWNWSRIHQGKTFLDRSGKSLSCGMSDSRMKRHSGSVSQIEGNASNLATASDHFTSSSSPEIPLLYGAQESQGSGSNHFVPKDYSGELEFFSNHCSRDDEECNLVSAARSCQQRSRRCGHGRHRSLLQKYMPKTFRDFVGHSLVVQALSSSILRGKIGPVYVFYGPRGSGKTSCARVFAKALNCRSLEHPKPCDACSSCISYNLGKSRDVLELGPISNFNFKSINEIFKNLMLSPKLCSHRVFIIDDCYRSLSKLWSVLSKVIDQAPRHVVFVLICSNLHCIPHIILSRCQKFFFPKLKDSDIISTLEWIATSEGLEIDKDALKLIASQSNGSLRDAEMTLDQLSLLGKKISLPLVQELVGLVTDDKLLDLLDMALSADTVNTVKSLRELSESGVDPVMLMSQLATIITDILAVSKEDIERLRQALRKLSEAEKQLRVSNDKLTWLTAALLQIAPEQQYLLPSSSGRSSSGDQVIMRDKPRSSTNKQDEMQSGHRSFAEGAVQEHYNSKGVGDRSCSVTVANGALRGQQTESDFICSDEATRKSIMHSGKKHGDTEKIWQEVLDHISSDALRQFLYDEGNLNSVSLGAAPTVQLIFSSRTNKSRAEKFEGYILQAFESVLGSPVTLEMSSKSSFNATSNQAACFCSFDSASSKAIKKPHSMKKQNSLYSVSDDLKGKFTEANVLRKIGSNRPRWLGAGPHIMKEGEIIEAGSPELRNKSLGMQKIVCAREEASTSQHHANLSSSSEWKEIEHKQIKSLVRGKVSLAHVLQQAEDCSHQGGRSRCKAMSIAKKLEQENLFLSSGDQFPVARRPTIALSRRSCWQPVVAATVSTIHSDGGSLLLSKDNLVWGGLGEEEKEVAMKRRGRWWLTVSSAQTKGIRALPRGQGKVDDYGLRMVK